MAQNINFQLSDTTAMTPGLVKTKIICTVGPASNTKEKIGQLVEAGMVVMRSNFSHGTHESHAAVIANLREYLAESKKLCAVLLDTKGPEIRSGKLTAGRAGVDLVSGQKFTILCGSKHASVLGDATQVYVDYANIGKVLKAGDHVLFDDGLIDMVVQSASSDKVQCEVMNGGKLGETKGVNLPGVPVDLPAVTEKDKADIAFGIEQGIDFIAASFVRNAAAVEEIRKLLGPRGRGIKIISKIENAQGMQNFDEILKASDGIMVARGDLGVEIPIEKVSLAQKMMIHKCNLAGKPVVTATQMLDSMIHNPRPTRAEATDVANAVFDGSDCVMLSGETANGKYPVEAVTMMAKICRTAENATDYAGLYRNLREKINLHSNRNPIVESITSSAVKTASDLQSTLIIALTETGYTGRLLSKYRPQAPVLCLTANEQTARQLLVSRGVYPIIVGSMIGSDSIIARTVSHAKDMGLCKAGELVVATSGRREGVAGHTNLLKVLTVV